MRRFHRLLHWFQLLRQKLSLLRLVTEWCCWGLGCRRLWTFARWLPAVSLVAFSLVFPIAPTTTVDQYQIYTIINEELSRLSQRIRRMPQRKKPLVTELIYSPHKSLRILVPWIKPRVVLFHHTGSANMDGTIHWFLNRKSKVSSDFVIGKDGRIVRMVPKGWCGWHAGECTFDNKPTRFYNFLSYGVELVNRGDGIDPYPERQLEAAAYVVALIQKEALTVTLLRRHGDVAVPKGRKSDPLGLSLERIYDAVRKYQPQVSLE